MENAPAPCPHRTVDDMGSAFAMGCLGGSVWHFFKGMRNSPKGYRLHGGYTAVTLRAPVLGGNFAVWGGLFSVFDCSFIHLRGKEDPLNAVAAGAATGGLLAARSGMKAFARNAFIGGALLAMIEGLSVLVSSKMNAPQQPPPVMGNYQVAPAVHGPGGVIMPGVTTGGTAGLVRSPMDHESDQAAGFPSHESPTPIEEMFNEKEFAFDGTEDFADEL